LTITAMRWLDLSILTTRSARAFPAPATIHSVAATATAPTTPRIERSQSFLPINGRFDRRMDYQ
jgi:hypothetical protein